MGNDGEGRGLLISGWVPPEQRREPPPVRPPPKPDEASFGQRAIRIAREVAGDLRVKPDMRALRSPFRSELRSRTFRRLVAETKCTPEYLAAHFGITVGMACSALGLELRVHPTSVVPRKRGRQIQCCGACGEQGHKAPRCPGRPS